MQVRVSDRAWSAVIAMVFVLLAIVVSSAASGCAPCTAGQAKCQGNILQVCSGSWRGWVPALDCSDTTPGVWICNEEEEACVPSNTGD